MGIVGTQSMHKRVNQIHYQHQQAQKCGNELDGRVFFDFTTGSFFCEECREGGAREINLSTYDALCAVENGQTVPDERAFRALRLLDYYLVNKAEESLTNLKELLKLSPVAE